MGENMMNSDHKSSNEKSRKNHDRIFGYDPRDPTQRLPIASSPYRSPHHIDDFIVESNIDEFERCGTCERGRCDGCTFRDEEILHFGNLDEDDRREER
jgi:hypothetical protein